MDREFRVGLCEVLMVAAWCALMALVGLLFVMDHQRAPLFAAGMFALTAVVTLTVVREQHKTRRIMRMLLRQERPSGLRSVDEVGRPW